MKTLLFITLLVTSTSALASWCETNRFEGTYPNYSAIKGTELWRTYCDASSSKHLEESKFTQYKDFIQNANCGGESPRPSPPETYWYPQPAQLALCEVWRAQCLEAFHAWLTGPRNDALSEFIVEELQCLEY